MNRIDKDKMTKERQIINFIETTIQSFIDSIRPPVDMRDQVDIGYIFKSNTLEIFEIRPRWDKKEEMIHSPFAKTRFVKTRGVWNIYWMRASGKWELYKPNSEVKDISDFFEILREDTHGCFFG